MFRSPVFLCRLAISVRFAALISVIIVLAALWLLRVSVISQGAAKDLTSAGVGDQGAISVAGAVRQSDRRFTNDDKLFSATVPRLGEVYAEIVTVNWQRNAFGQTFPFPCAAGTYNWPNNNNWTQQEAMAVDNVCNPPQSYIAQPSNWTTPTYPNGPTFDVVLGDPAPASVDLHVNVQSITVLSGAGNINMTAGSSLTSQSYDFQTDGIFTNVGGGGTIPYISVPGTFAKTAGAGVLDVSGGNNDIYFNIDGGTVQANNGTLKLSRGESVGGTFSVASGAAIDVTNGSNFVHWSGTYNGTGAGAVQFNNGTIGILSPGATLNFAGDLFQWSGGALGAGPPTNNTGTINLVGSNGKQIDGGGFTNSGTMTQDGTGNLHFGTNAFMTNAASGTYDLRSDAGFDNGLINNYGTFKKTGGSGISKIYGGTDPNSTYFNHLGGTVEVDSGTLMLGRGESTGANFIVGGGAVLDLTSGSDFVNYQGTYTGSGSGAVQLNGGQISTVSPGVTFSFPGNLFKWGGGTINAGQPFSNVGTMTMFGPGGKGIGGGAFTNNGSMIQTGTGDLGFGTNAFMTNAAGGTYDIQSDAGVSNGLIANNGLFKKSGGAGVSQIYGGTNPDSAYFNQLGGTVEVDSGTLKLGRGENTGGTYIVGSGAVLDLNSGSNFANYQGIYTGSGAGAVQLNAGQLTSVAPGVTFNFQGGLFQWNGGTFNAGAPFTNTGTITLVGSGGKGIGGTGFSNQGTMIQTGTGNLGFANNSSMTNAPGGTYDIQSDAGIDNGVFVNQGMFKKTAGSGTSQLYGGTDPNSAYFNHSGGTVEVDSGTLKLGRSESTGGNFIVGAGSIVDLNSGSSFTNWVGTFTGTGAGSVQLNGGNINIGGAGATFNFSDGLFQWSGGGLNTSGPLTNMGTIDLAGTGDKSVGGNALNNDGTIRGTGTLHAATLVNNRTIAPGSSVGRLDFDGNLQLGPTSDLSFDIGGTSQGNDYDLLNKTNGGAITLDGTLSIYLANGFKPAGSDVFTILTTQNALVGVFSNVASGARLNTSNCGGTFVVTYAGMNGVTLTSFRPTQARADFDGDCRTDTSVYRPDEGNWYADRSSQGFIGTHFGDSADIPAPGDFDGDGKTDITVFRPSTGVWYRINSSDSSSVLFIFGLTGDIPHPGDFDGDGKDDIAVFRPSTGTWYWQNSSDGQFGGVQFGQNGDLPVAGDYDGDGKEDVSVFRPSNGIWYRLNSSTGDPFALNFGLNGDIPTPADYDGDAIEDIAVFRPSDGNWYRINSSDGQFNGTHWGQDSDVPVPGDFDGDGKYEQAIYRSGTWYVNGSTSGLTISVFGLPTDIPLPRNYIP